MVCKITVLPQNKIITAKKSSRLSDVLIQNGINVSAHCGGIGRCGKCKIKLLNGKVDGAAPDNKGLVKSCHCYITEDISIEIFETGEYEINEVVLADKPSTTTELGVVLDIGTTTLAACLVDTKNGKIYKKATCFNPQRIYGSDVLSRITASSNGNFLNLQKLILSKTDEILNLFSQNGKFTLKNLVVAANTTMLHLFLGVDPTPIGTYPFTPVFTNTKLLKGEELGLSVQNVRLLPSASGYIGADITAGILATGIHKSKDPVLFVDIGTNGEIALVNNGKIYATSTAAGPAIEGATMQCGLSGVSGAINRVFLRGDKFGFTTIDNTPAKGICGSGYIDLIALLLKENIIDEYGGWNYDSKSFLISKLVDDCFYLTENVFLSKRDISEFQLAKGAIMAGIKSLLNYCQLNAKDIAHLYLAGGMGYYITVQNAAITGLLPYELAHKSTATENTSVEGARLCLTNQNAQKEIEEIADNTQVVELSFLEDFQSEYTNNMRFKLEY